MSKLDTALQVAGLGFKVFPLAAGKKGPPLLQEWNQKATTDETEIRGWWTVWPNANIGIHAAGLVVIDVDTRNNGDETLAALQAQVPIPPTLTTRTPTGGRHLFFRLPEGHPGVTNGANALGPGLDVKSTNGYLVAPGSEVDAGRYKFMANIPAVPAPKWLLERLQARAERVRETTPADHIPDAAELLVAQARSWLTSQPSGEGAYGTACGLRDRGLSLLQAKELMAEHDPRPNVDGKVEHAYKYAQGDPGSKVAVAADFPAPVQGEAPLSAPTPADPGGGAPVPGKASGPRPMAFDDWAMPGNGVDYVIKGVLSRGSYAAMYGPPGEGKTFNALDMSRHVAAGKEWHGHRVKQGAVLYITFEGLGGLKKRGAALKHHYHDKELPLYLLHGRMNVRTPEGRRDLAAAVAIMPAMPTLIVLDTFARAMMGGDENSAQDVGAFNDAIEGLIKATGACVMVIHHPTKAGTGLRGSGALLGAIDTEIEVNKKKLTVLKQRDFEAAVPVEFMLRPITVGFDADGDEITSCVVLPAAKRPEGQVDGSKVSGRPKAVFEVLAELRPTNEPITRTELMEACKVFLPERGPRQRFHEALVSLKRFRLIEENDDLITRRLL